jgi:hypothetical protein
MLSHSTTTIPFYTDRRREPQAYDTLFINANVGCVITLGGDRGQLANVSKLKRPKVPTPIKRRLFHPSGRIEMKIALRKISMCQIKCQEEHILCGFVIRSARGSTQNRRMREIVVLDTY